jgi:hypothetical protein
MLTRLLDHTELAMRLEPQTCCFFAGRVGALWPGAVVLRLAWSDASMDNHRFRSPSDRRPESVGCPTPVTTAASRMEALGPG